MRLGRSRRMREPRIDLESSRGQFSQGKDDGVRTGRGSRRCGVRMLGPGNIRRITDYETEELTKTTMSSKEFAPSLFAPCTLTQAASPAAYNPSTIFSSPSFPTSIT